MREPRRQAASFCTIQNFKKGGYSEGLRAGGLDTEEWVEDQCKRQ